MALNLTDYILLYDPEFMLYIKEQGLSNLLDDISANKSILLKYRKEYDMKLEINKDFDIPINEPTKITKFKERYYKAKNDSTK
jgi:hypothetical protein